MAGVMLPALRSVVQPVIRDVLDPHLAGGSLGPPLPDQIIDALGASLRQFRYLTPDFAGLYQDAAGTTPVTAVGQPVGLMLDRRFGLVRGPDIPLAPQNAQWQHNPDGTYTKVEEGFSQLRATTDDAVVVGTHYEAIVEVAPGATGSLTLYRPNETGGSGVLAMVPYEDGPFRFTFQAIHDSGRVAFLDGSGFLGTVRFTVREIPGNHASQPTTTARPTLLGNPLRLSFDGVDDSLVTTFPDLGSNVTIARSIPGTGAQILTGQTISGEWVDNVTSCATLVIDRALTGSETALVTAFLNQQAGV